MRHMIAGLMLGLASLASTAVHADDTFGTTGLRLTVDSWRGQASLLSNANGTLRLNLAGMDVTYGDPITLVSPNSGGPFENSTEYQDTATARFDLDLQAGYRVTSITLTGTVTGRVEPGVFPPDVTDVTPGVASNPFEISLRNVTETWAGIVIEEQSWDSVPGDRAISLRSNLIHDTDFTLGLYSAMDLYAASALAYQQLDDWGIYHLEPSTVSLSVSDLVLTIQVSPVPEPSSWAMLAAGAGLLAFTARKRNKA